MKAAIIAAGEGSRLKSEGIDVPKPLVRVNGIPLIERLIRSYAGCGLSEVVCIVNEYSLEVKEYIEGRDLGIPVKFTVRTTPSSMHSLFALAPHLTGGKFLLSTVDSIFDERDLDGYLKHSDENPGLDGLLAVTNFIDDENPLYVQVDGNMRILKFAKSDGGTAVSPWVTGGLYILSPRIFTEMDAVLACGIERLRNFLSHLIKKDYLLGAYPFSRIVDVDHTSDIRMAEEMLKLAHHG